MRWVVSASLVIMIISCNKLAYHEISSATIHIEKVKVDFAQVNDWSHNVRDVWIYIDDIYAGSFTYPLHISIADMGTHTISIYPGIRFFGILAKPEIYTLLDPWSTTVQINERDTILLEPAFKYKSNINFTLDESFESAHSFNNDLDSLPSTQLSRSTIGPRSGNYFGSLSVNTTNRINEVASSSFPYVKGKNTFIELDFKSDHSFAIGVMDPISKDKNYFISLNPTDNVWKKLYIPLFEIVDASEVNLIQLAFRLQLNAPTQSTAQVGIDNIKILSLK